MFFSNIIFNFFFQNWPHNPGSGSGTGFKLGQNPWSGSKFNLFGSTTLVEPKILFDSHKFFKIHLWKNIFLSYRCKNNGTCRKFWIWMVNFYQSVQPLSSNFNCVGLWIRIHIQLQNRIHKVAKYRSSLGRDPYYLWKFYFFLQF